MKGFKGFNKDLKCRGFQFEQGKEYKEERAECCETGFHFCESPLDVFGYYPPSNSRYCEVEGSGQIDKENRDDSKVAASQIKIGLEIGLPGLIKAGVEYIKSNVDWENAKETNTGNYSAATNTGDYSAATVEGKESIACALGMQAKAKGKIGCWIVLAEWEEVGFCDRKLKQVKAFEIDGEIIKEDIFYVLENGQAIEFKED